MIELPFGSEFSPSQIDLAIALEICKDNEGNRDAVEAAILNRFFLTHGHGNEKNRQKLAMNCRLGLKNYGILDEACNFTPLGTELYMQRMQKEKMYETFARHILLNLSGMAFVQCIRDMQTALQKVTLETLKPELEIRGITYPSAGKHPSIMRLWLEQAGVFSSKWNIHNDRVREILGDEDRMETLRGLTKAQRYFLLALLNTGKSEFQISSRVARLAGTAYGVSYPEKTLPKSVLAPLEDAGYIETEKATVGRGAKSHYCRPTEKAKIELLQPLISQLEGQTDPKLIELLTKNIPDILTDIDSSNTYIAGLALEALAFKILRILGLEYIATRARTETTGGSEVDLLFQSLRPAYLRWQIQCKNTARVALEHVAREVGLSQMLYSNIIVMITTGSVSSEAKKYANHMMRNTNLSILFLEKSDIDRIAADPVSVIDIFEDETRKAMQLKRLDL